LNIPVKDFVAAMERLLNVVVDEPEITDVPKKLTVPEL
jgi:hypothetical protein